MKGEIKKHLLSATWQDFLGNLVKTTWGGVKDKAGHHMP